MTIWQDSEIYWVLSRCGGKDYKVIFKYKFKYKLQMQIQRLLTRTWVGSDQGVLFLERGGRYIRQHWQRKEVWGINNHTTMENKEKSQNIAQTSFQLESGMGRNACSMKGDKFSCTMTVWITSYNYCFSQWIALSELHRYYGLLDLPPFIASVFGSQKNAIETFGCTHTCERDDQDFPWVDGRTVEEGTPRGPREPKYWLKNY